LQERRGVVTRQLLGAVRPQPEYFALEWWRTCCEPGVIADGDLAGGLRATLLLQDQLGRSATYVFDVLATDTGWLYDGLPARGWTLVDIYRPDEEPVDFRWPREGPRPRR
jgi:hypothetical protein